MEIKYWTAEDFENEVFAMGFVENPAIEDNFIYLSKDYEEIIKLAVDDEKRIVVGYALIPEIPIERKDGFYKFSKETIQTLAHRFLTREYNNEATYNHDFKINGVELLESWIVENENDKISNYGKKVIIGGWVLMYHISNDNLWNDIKISKIKGYSIEAKLGEKENLSLEDVEDRQLLVMMLDLIEKLKS